MTKENIEVVNESISIIYTYTTDIQQCMKGMYNNMSKLRASNKNNKKLSAILDVRQSLLQIHQEISKCQKLIN